MAFIYAVLRILFYCIVGVVIAIVGSAYFFMTWEPDRSLYPYRGIDVSHHNGTVDWQKVAGDDVAFAYMKASEGADFSDPAFGRNWREAGEAGLQRGAYHFFSWCSKGEDQARHFLTKLPRDQAMLPPMLDLEIPQEVACSQGIDQEPEVVRREIVSFVSLVERTLRTKVIFYAPEDFFRQYLRGAGVNRPLWVRSLWRSPAYSQDWMFWQYHARGQVEGIETDVDLNVLGRKQTIEELLIRPAGAGT